MARPFLLAQISDPHLGEPAAHGLDPEDCLRRVVKAIGKLPDLPDAILVSGDLAEHGKRKEYRLAAKLIGKLGIPFYALPGNHDDRATLREVLDHPGEGDAPLDYTVDFGPLRLVVIDSTIPGEDRGGFEPGQLERLEAELTASPLPAIVAMHHPPLSTAMPDWDGVNLSVSEREALAEVIARHPQVKAIVAGHLHRASVSALAGRPVLSAPSIFLGARPDYAHEEVGLYGSAPGFVIHALRGEELASQIEIVAPA